MTQPIQRNDEGLRPGLGLLTLQPALQVLASDDFEPPRLPSAVWRAMHLSQKEEVRFRELHEVLESDSLLAARALKAVRSPLHGRFEVRSLRDALVRLGTSRVRDLVFELAFEGPIFSSHRYAEQAAAIQRHSRAVAHIARVIAKAASVPSEQTFLCGLLHEIGMLALLELAEEYVPGASDEALFPEISRCHEEGSGRIAKAWGLPPDVCAALAAHHHLDAVTEPHRPLVAVIMLSEAVVGRLGAAAPHRLDASTAGELQRAMDALGLRKDQLVDVVREGQDIVAAIGAC